MIFLLSISLFLFSNQSFAIAPLQFLQLKYLSEAKELSGLFYQEGNLYTVADKPEDHYIYKLEIIQNDSSMKIVPHINLKELKGYKSYFYANFLLPQFGHWLQSPLDLEGITRCGDDFYLVNEQVRHVLKVNTTEITKLEIDFLGYFDKNIIDAKSIPKNAGFEGISADCIHKRLYIAQERNPRSILIINMDTNQILGHFTIEPTKDQLYPDFASLHFDNGHLYILERNSYQITKYSLLSKKVVARVSFKDLAGFDLENLYETGEPYGLAEGLAMSKEKIFLVLDNNRSPLSEIGQKHFSIQGNGASYLEFKRPQDF